MREKRRMTKKRMQTQSKPSNRLFERNKIKTTDNNEGKELSAFKSN